MEGFSFFVIHLDLFFNVIQPIFTNVHFMRIENTIGHATLLTKSWVSRLLLLFTNSLVVVLVTTWTRSSRRGRGDRLTVGRWDHKLFIVFHKLYMNSMMFDIIC